MLVSFFVRIGALTKSGLVNRQGSSETNRIISQQLTQFVRVNKRSLKTKAHTQLSEAIITKHTFDKSFFDVVCPLNLVFSNKNEQI